ncbi:hypothetical protein ILYODFUR_028656 [Ilyodon furcidens]|uniref:Secreted protein n=1 Tax=Ilyodon furcidens TaxID=33524 RepID=A0ABV0TEC4_9TELE
MFPFFHPLHSLLRVGAYNLLLFLLICFTFHQLCSRHPALYKPTCPDLSPNKTSWISSSWAVFLTDHRLFMLFLTATRGTNSTNLHGGYVDVKNAHTPVVEV